MIEFGVRRRRQVVLGQVRAHRIAGIEERLQRGSRARQIGGFERMDRILSPGERGNEKHRPHYRQPAKGVDGSAENTRNRSSRKLNEGGYRHLVSLLVVGQVRVDRELRQESR